MPRIEHQRKLAGNRAYRAEHRERLNALWLDKWRSDAGYRGATPLRGWRGYGLSGERHRQMSKRTASAASAGAAPEPRRHCDVTQQVRCLQYDNCNTGIGLLGHDPRRLRPRQLSQRTAPFPERRAEAVRMSAPSRSRAAAASARSGKRTFACGGRRGLARAHGEERDRSNDVTLHPSSPVDVSPVAKRDRRVPGGRSSKIANTS
jgi:hypothetical protein